MQKWFYKLCQTSGGLAGKHFNHKIAMDYVGPFDGHLFTGIEKNEFYILTITDTHTLCRIPCFARNKDTF